MQQPLTGTGSCDTTVVEQSLTQLQEEVAGLHRLALLGTMAAMVAHEWNNLATPVLARAEYSLSLGDVPMMKKALERTVINTRKSIAIAQRLLGLARGGQAPMQACSVRKGVEEVIEATARPVERDRIEVRINVPPELCVRATPVLFEQVLLNLYLNARQALKDANGTISFAARRQGDAIAIDVRDSGPGMTRERIEAVVNPFLSSAAVAAPDDWLAVGLGLNVCRTIAQLHDASIHAQANEGPGCTFTLLWPAA